jgi:site-specific DNA recombinase
MKLDGYVRVSKVNGRSGASFISPEVQRESIERWAEATGHEILKDGPVDGWWQELDRSGGRGKKRPVFEVMLGRVTRGESQGVAVWKLSRFGRSALDAGLLIREIQDAGGVVESATEGEQSKFIRLVYLGMAEEELDRITESWANARRRAVDRGVTIGPAPFGYWRTAEGTLEPNEQAPIVKEAFKIAAVEGLQGGRRYLERFAPAQKWRLDKVRRLLTNRAYVGDVVCGELVKAGAHEPLTTPELFAAVQALSELGATPRRTSGEYPLSGIATCGKCGSTMIGNLQSVHGRRYRRMRCSNDLCRGTSINADKLEAYVKDRLGVALGARALRVRVDEGGLGDAREKLELATADLRRWVEDDRSRDLIGGELFYAGTVERVSAVAAAEREYGEVAGQAARSEVIPASSDLEDPAQMVRALAAMVKTVKVKAGRGSIRERSEIEWTDEFANVGESENARVPNVGNPFQTTATEKTIEKGMKALAEGQRQRHPGAVVEPNLPVSHA